MSARARTPVAVLCAFLAGVPLTAVGAGLGITHLEKEGPGPVGILGLAALVLGLVLLVLGGAGLVRLARRWWRLLVLPLVLVIAVLGVYVLAVPLRAAAPARAAAPEAPPDGLVVETVHVPTSDGEQLAGWFLPAQDGATVVLLPGAGSSRRSLGQHVRTLAEAGYGVLALDPRGQGDSSGRGMDWGWYGEEDVPSAVTYLTGRTDVDPRRIAVMGLSMGGEQAIGAAAVDPRVRAVVAEGVTARQATDLHWLSDVYGWRGAVTESLHAAQTSIADLVSPASPPTPLREAAATAAPRPILLVVAGQKPDEGHAAGDIQQASPSSVQVWVVTGAGHTAGLRIDPSGWSERVLGFLEEATS